ncbi:Dehydration-responsive element-binding protein 1E [Rhynchospora pubera]|uniref:Dehydration-responsive element-binding protein 1E n=1 Tax=Rhynchospora pubera TaxID=906938 RepID=A0AAV8H3J3_9POAL|nr:Dehydration-responsive element-binding protein 1E [Rhynchospora pubera]KAJ4811919.1 Dehydration-responsive element-binding protein 1E [Rhynchospora pubera]
MEESQRSSNSDDELYTYNTISSAPPKRRAGRTKFRETRHPTFKGVRRRNADRWVCEVREPNKKSRIWLGTFPTAEMAARAHDVAAMTLRGRSACLNFADSPKLLTVPGSTSPRSIQRAAAEAAELFRPTEERQEGTSTSTTENSKGDALQVDPFSESFEFGMQGYLDMAQGMLIDPPPPPMDAAEDVYESDADVELWSYSI